MNEGQDVEIRISILSKTKEEVRDYLQMRFNKLGTRNMDEVLIGMINKKLIIPILKELSIDKDMKARDISNNQVDSLAELLVSWSFKVIGRDRKSTRLNSSH